MAIDYEKEYDNRGRVPEHPEIFARWQRETAAYRSAARGAQLGLAYGPSPRQTLDLFPAMDGNESAPLAMFIHGGWWRSLSPTMFSQTRQGPERARRHRGGRRLRPLPAGDASPPSSSRCAPPACGCGANTASAFSSTAIPPAAISPPAWWRRTGRRFAADAPDDLVPAAYAISGVFDLAPLLQRVAEPGPAARPGRERGACRRCIGRCRPAARSMRWSARSNRANSCARARPSPTPGGRAWSTTRYEAHRRRQPFHRARSADRSAKRDDATRRRARARRQFAVALEPITPRERNGKRGADRDHQHAHHLARDHARDVGAGKPAGDGTGHQRQRLRPRHRALHDEHDGGGEAVQAGDEILRHIGASGNRRRSPARTRRGSRCRRRRRNSRRRTTPAAASSGSTR